MANKMKAVVYRKYGPPNKVLEIKEVDKPAPEDDEIQVKVHAAAVNFSDWTFVRGVPFMVRMMFSVLLKPKYPILGADIAGLVEEVGKNVTQFQPGDEVFGDVSESGWGGFAEFVTGPENVFALKPANLTFEEAAAVPQAALVALQGLRNEGRIKRGHKVLIVGASGGIGTFAVQLAKSFGAEVTGVCSTKNVDLVRSLGADHVIDYKREDFAQNGELYDLILATAGYRPILDYKHALSPRGTYVMAGGSMKQVFEAMLKGSRMSEEGGKTLVNLEVKPSQDDLVFITDLIENGKVVPVIDSQFPLGEVAEALLHYGKGHSRGKVIIIVDSNIKLKR